MFNKALNKDNKTTYAAKTNSDEFSNKTTLAYIKLHNKQGIDP